MESGSVVDAEVVARDILALFDDDGWDRPAVLAHLAVTPTAGGISVTVTQASELDGHPRSVLEGHRVDDTVDGLALVFEAWVTAGGPSMPWAPSQAADRVEARSCLVVLRDGRHAAAVHERNGGTNRQDEAGPLLDTLLRMVDAPTPPPADNAGALLALHTWLNIVADHADHARRPLTWEEAVDVLAPPDETGHPDDGPVSADVAGILRKLGDAMPPAAVYAVASAQNPDLRWHDVGSFTRAVTSPAFSTYSDALDDDARRAAITVWQDLHTSCAF